MSKIETKQITLVSENGLVETNLTLGNDGVLVFDKPISTDIKNDLYTAPTLLNSWVNFGSPFEDVGYMKDSMGWVHFKGMIKSGVTTDGTGLFQSPSGYFKSGVVTYIPVYSSDAFGGIIITTTGLVTFHQGLNVWLSLDNVMFYVGN